MTHILKNILSSVCSIFQKRTSFGMLVSGDSIYEITYGDTIKIPRFTRHKISSIEQRYHGEWRFKVEVGAIYIQESEMDKTMVDRKFSHLFLASSIKNVKKLVRQSTKAKFIPNYMGILFFNKYINMKMDLNGIQSQHKIIQLW